MSGADHDSIKDCSFLLPLCLCDNIPLTSLGEIWTFRYTAHCGLKVAGKHSLSINHLGTSCNGWYGNHVCYFTWAKPVSGQEVCQYWFISPIKKITQLVQSLKSSPTEQDPKHLHAFIGRKKHLVLIPSEKEMSDNTECIGKMQEKLWLIIISVVQSPSHFFPAAFMNKIHFSFPLKKKKKF